MISPFVDAQRFALVASVLRPAVSELLRASDAEVADKQQFTAAAAVVDWLISRAEGSSVVFNKLDERVAAQMLEQPIPDQSEAEKAQKEMLDFPRPPMPASFTTFYDLPVTRAALAESEQILRWSTNTACLAAADRIQDLRAHLDT